MTNIGLIAIAIVMCGAAATTAQTARRTAPPAPVHVMIIGCVEPSDQPTGTAGTSGNTSDTKYKLTNAHTTTSKAKTNASSNKNQNKDDSAGGNTSSKTYQLSGNGPAVAAEVGHVVEIVAVEEQPPSGGKAPTRAAGTPVMVVEDVKLVSPNCQ